MPTFSKCKAIVLSETVYNECDKMLTAISDNYGKISISSRGCMKQNSRFLAVSQCFCYSEMELSLSKNGIYTLSDATLISSFYDLRTDYELLTEAFKIAKTALTVSQEELPDTDLLRLLLNTLYKLNENKKPKELINAIFNIRLAFDQGVLPEQFLKSEASKAAFANILTLDSSKIFSFTTPQEVNNELESIGNKAHKILVGA